MPWRLLLSTCSPDFVFQLAVFQRALVRKQIAEALDTRDQLADELARAVRDRRLQSHQFGLRDELRDQLVDLVELGAIAHAQVPELAERADAELRGCRRRTRT